MVSKAGLTFVQELVIGFGFLNGLWIHAGANPEAEILKGLTNLIPEMSGFLFWSISIALISVSIYVTYFIGGWVGIVAIFLAFIGGITIESTIGVYLLFGGIILGLFAPMAGVSSNQI